MEIVLDLSDDEAQDIMRHVHRYKYYKGLEETTTIAEYEVFDLEDAFGSYQWLIERIDKSLV